MTSQYAFCSVSLSPMRASAADSSEMISQLIFGEIVELLKEDRQWRQVKSAHDNYIGWLDVKCLTSISEQEMVNWKNNQSLLFNETLRVDSLNGQLLLTKGAFVPKFGKSFEIGNEKYQLLEKKIEVPKSIAGVAYSFINSPYLWGGKTLFGIDCSGFTQIVFRFMQISIPRDACLQAQKGLVVEFENRKEGDLAFFKNSGGNIHHVGIILEDSKIIHAHGWLRIDNLDKFGIMGRMGVIYSHELAFIKRIVD